MIVGYPTEGEEHFNNTLNLIRKIRPDWINVSKYGHRPKTEASKLDPLNTNIINERSRIVSEDAIKISWEKKQEWLGWEGSVLVSRRGKQKTQWFGRNISYEPIIVESEDEILGKVVRVKIENTTSFSLLGTII